VKATQPDDCGARDDDLDILARYGKIKTGSNFADYCSERLMKFKVTVLFTIVSLLLFVGPSAAADFTYQEYTKTSELWKRGFAFGISRYMSAVAQPDEEAPYPVRAAFQRCLTGSTDALLVRQVEAYVAANPAGSKGPMVAVIIKAFFDMCRAEIERAQSPKGAPSQR
jgi:hypothetical protein